MKRLLPMWVGAPRLDPVLLALLLLIIVFGLVVLYSASGQNMAVVERQVVRLGIVQFDLPYPRLRRLRVDRRAARDEPAPAGRFEVRLEGRALILQELGGEGRRYRLSKDAFRTGNVEVTHDSRAEPIPPGAHKTQAKLRLRPTRNDVRFETFLPWHGSWDGRATVRLRFHLECASLEIQRLRDPGWSVHPVR